MSPRSYYDPHYKPDRSPSKYRSDKRLDEIGASEAAAFVAKFLSSFKVDKSGRADPAEVFKALRIEARRLRSTSQQEPEKAKKKKKRNKNRVPVQRNSQPSHPWLKRKSSLKFLKYDDVDLMIEYYSTCSKIERWREERAQSVDEKRKATLAGQVQIQLEKRHDLLALIYDRAIEGDAVLQSESSARIVKP
ncbi:hypothetical protein [Pseudooceanicola nitratireducens]|uniref:hypothetical protein n=1 Tax=Pseudooceanicola nitratireducens TaxID=517719 RepID=UPI001C989AC4|nr:hypothetical protein [Pseudooceanicola nitratireducens]MBY6157468.1 hypothetical protein [Pseudooceanicola nitratireducens]